MRFTVDPWDPAYGMSLETDLARSDAPVVADVELAEAAWRPCAPAPGTPAPPAVLFVDGVRRIEARAWIHTGDGDAVPGVFASYAAGVVRCDRASTVAAARVVDVRVARGVFAPHEALADVETRGGPFAAHPTRDATPETLTYAVHVRMSECEVRVAEEARRSGDELILLDGPLRHRNHIPDAVGIVKTHHVRYLPEPLDRVVGALAPGERTPVFRVEAQPFARTSWYVRLPGPDGGPWAGVVRCEASGALATAAVVGLADRVTAILPTYASEGHKDPRAPQNLYPIGGLERELRRRLGDPQVLYRALRVVSAANAWASPA